jgi:hypothetical protein
MTEEEGLRNKFSEIKNLTFKIAMVYDGHRFK